MEVVASVGTFAAGAGPGGGEVGFIRGLIGREADVAVDAEGLRGGMKTVRRLDGVPLWERRAGKKDGEEDGERNKKRGERQLRETYEVFGR